MSIVTAADREGFTEEVFQADNDSRTTGVFLLLIAPRKDGFVREAMLTVGDLPFEPVMDRIIKQSAAKLAEHNKREEAQ